MDILIMFGVFAISFIAGWQARELYAIKMVHKLIEQAEAEAEASTDEEPQVDAADKMRLEKHNDVIYAYIVESGEFVAQGKTLEDLDEAIQIRYPGRKFSIREQNLKDISVDYHEPV